jgi:hypothetical protein
VLLLTWGEWIELMLGRRGREALRLVSAGTFVFGALFAREEIAAVFIGVGETATQALADAFREAMPDVGTPGSPPSTTAP